MTSLKQEHQPRPHAERQAKADALRAKQLRAKQNKAAMETDKIHNAASRKALEVGDDRTFTCTFGDGEAAADNTRYGGTHWWWWDSWWGSWDAGDSWDSGWWSC